MARLRSSFAEADCKFDLILLRDRYGANSGTRKLYFLLCMASLDNSAKPMSLALESQKNNAAAQDETEDDNTPGIVRVVLGVVDIVDAVRVLSGWDAREENQLFNCALALDGTKAHTKSQKYDNTKLWTSMRYVRVRNYPYEKIANSMTYLTVAFEVGQQLVGTRRLQQLTSNLAFKLEEELETNDGVQASYSIVGSIRDDLPLGEIPSIMESFGHLDDADKNGHARGLVIRYDPYLPNGSKVDSVPFNLRPKGKDLDTVHSQASKLAMTAHKNEELKKEDLQKQLEFEAEQRRCAAFAAQDEDDRVLAIGYTGEGASSSMSAQVNPLASVPRPKAARHERQSAKTGKEKIKEVTALWNGQFESGRLHHEMQPSDEWEDEQQSNRQDDQYALPPGHADAWEHNADENTAPASDDEDNDATFSDHKIDSQPSDDTTFKRLQMERMKALTCLGSTNSESDESDESDDE